MKRIAAILATIMLTSCTMSAPIDTIKNVDYEISYWNAGRL